MAEGALQILLCPGSDAIECLLDILDRVGHAEAQITLAEVAEGSPRKRGDAGVVEQRVGQFLRWPSGPFDVWENVERALRQEAGETFDLVEAGDHDIATLLKLGAHFIDRALWPAQCLDTGHLCKAGGAGIRVSHESGDMR